MPIYSVLFSSISQIPEQTTNLQINRTVLSSAIMFSFPSIPRSTLWSNHFALSFQPRHWHQKKQKKKRPLVPHILHHHTSLSIPYSSAACYCIQRFKNILQRNTTLKQLGLHVPTGGQPIILHAKKTWHPMFCKRLKVDKRAYYNFYVLVLEHRWRKREQGSVHMLPYSLMV